MRAQHRERHQNTRIGWLRATVLGANDGIVSTASLIVGVAASGAARGDLLVAGMAALVAGAMSMAAGEYVSVSSQADTERADLAREAQELRDDPEFELRELTQIYVGRGLEPALASQVASQLTAKDALAAHARDELNIVDATAARPIQAALASAVSFSAGAILPLACAMAAPSAIVTTSVVVTSLVSLAGLGAVSAQLGGANVVTAVLRVTIWGALALAVTAIVGSLFGAVA
ncbi:MAG: VIT family protein [Hyphomonadaceae bacterium]